ncbi:MAG TPA: CopD family protein [Solirubrobacteraceae bacterium]|jgi:copper transport protein|nr:CopD family protein [Solirubrobacteraceae bacterium]
MPAIALALLAGLLWSAPAALAHAQLLGTSPASGSTVATQPAEVIFEYNQSVGGTLGAVRVYDAQGTEVDNLDVSHPDGNEHWMGVGLKPDLPDGTYTATYRVISADTHIVYGGLVFNIGHAGAAPKFTVAGLIGRNRSGAITAVAFGVVRSLDYLTIALLLGGLAFLLIAWRPGFAAVADSEPQWQTAARMFAARLRLLLSVAVALGTVVSVLGILLQGGSAAGVSLWASLKHTVVQSTLESRFGEVWGLRAIAWVLLGVLLAAAAALTRRPPATTDVTGAETTAPTKPDDPALAPLPPRPLLGAIGLCAAYLAVTPALSGHASIQSPTAVFFPSDVVHVLAASVWVGGIACLLLALPAATRELDRPERSRLLLATLARFSPLALAAVVAIAATGVVQAYIDVRSLNGLLHTTYGALILAKTALLLALIGLGWVNRERVIPAFRRIVASERPPGQTGALARRTLRGELALLLCVFGLTAALISYAPPIDAASGPFSTNTTLGQAELEMTVEPARVGLNTIHLYLIDATTGAQFTATKELTATAALPAKHIGPLPLRVTVAGPGHYILSSAELSPGGDWEIQFTDRVSEFEEHTRTVQVPIQ